MVKLWIQRTWMAHKPVSIGVQNSKYCGCSAFDSHVRETDLSARCKLIWSQAYALFVPCRFPIHLVPSTYWKYDVLPRGASSPSILLPREPVPSFPVIDDVTLVGSLGHRRTSRSRDSVMVSDGGTSGRNAGISGSVFLVINRLLSVTEIHNYHYYYYYYY